MEDDIRKAATIFGCDGTCTIRCIVTVLAPKLHLSQPKHCLQKVEKPSNALLNYPPSVDRSGELPEDAT